MCFITPTCQIKPVCVFIVSCPIRVPSGAADFPGELFNRPESWIRYKYVNLLQYNTYTRGGHFAAMEVPELLVKDFREFVQTVETFGSEK